MQRFYLQFYFANNIADINNVSRMPWMNDKIMIIIYSNPIRTYSEYYSRVTNGIKCQADSMLEAQVNSCEFLRESTLFILLANYFYYI